ncbi:hypothetical protein FM101_07385 [Arthrobacter rhombi]|uniref:Uncharacterized protein n=1 Tax=Arthrobacter rhombi TaxID=71253 RepID=A0A1R4G371_9MICC|nr:hypothetical protein FM101_07385 [Arthrobacter rhombi]
MYRGFRIVTQLHERPIAALIPRDLGGGQPPTINMTIEIVLDPDFVVSVVH